MSRYKFENNVWITFYFKGNQCIGRTFINEDGDEFILAIHSVDVLAFTIPFAVVDDPKVLNLLGNSSINNKQNIIKAKQIFDIHLN